MQIILNNEDISRLNEIIGSLEIKQFKGNQEEYRYAIASIMHHIFKASLYSVIEETEDE